MIEVPGKMPLCFSISHLMSVCSPSCFILSSGWLCAQEMLAPAPGVSARHGGPISLLGIGEGVDTWHLGQLGPRMGGAPEMVPPFLRT